MDSFFRGRRGTTLAGCEAALAGFRAERAGGCGGIVNRGKESIILHLEEPTDREIFLNMVRQADVVTENFRPGVMARLGFSYDELSKINPRLIYASSSGFGQTGPLTPFPAYDTIVQAKRNNEHDGIPGWPAYPHWNIPL